MAVVGMAVVGMVEEVKAVAETVGGATAEVETVVVEMAVVRMAAAAMEVEMQQRSLHHLLADARSYHTIPKSHSLLPIQPRTHHCTPQAPGCMRCSSWKYESHQAANKQTSQLCSARRPSRAHQSKETGSHPPCPHSTDCHREFAQQRHIAG